MIKTGLTCNLLLACSLVIFALILSESDIKAQNTVGIGTPTPNSNAVLDLVSPNGNQGMLMPRITTTQRQGMTSSLGSGETGLVVFDTDLKQFFHWVDTTWVVGLGAFSDIAGGDLQGSYPNPTLRSDVVTSTTILDGSISSVDLADNSVDSNKILDNTIAAVDIATDAVGSDEIITGAVSSDEIVDGSIQSVDIATGAITTSNIADATVETADIASGGNNKVLITTAAGTVFWENITLFETSTLAEGSIFVGDVSNTAAALNAKGSGRILIGDGTSVQSLNVNGDINLSATGDAQINPGVIGSTEVTDNSLSRDDIGPNAIEASELADNAVDNSAIQDNVVSTAKIQDSAINNQKLASDAVTSAKINDGTIAAADLADDAVGTAKIDGEGSSDAVMTTTAAGNPQWESRANFGTSSLPNANIFVGDAGGSSQPRPISGDITLSNTGIVQINNDVIGTNEVTDNSLTVDDIGPNAIESSELADNAVDTGAIQSNAVTTAKISDDAVTPAKINGAGNNDAILTTDGAGNPQWEAKSGLDIDPTNEIQDLSLVANTLGLTGDPTPVDLSGYLDNTDSQDLTLAGNTLSLTGDATTVDLSGYLDNTDSQDLSSVLSQGNDAGGSAITNAADPTSAQDVATKNYVDALEAADNDGDPTNEFQDLSLAGNTLGLTDDATPVDLSGYLDNTDSQDLSDVLSQGNDAGGVKIVNVADPTNPQDVATMTYVDNITITGANIASNSVSSNNIVNGSITSADIGVGEVATPNIEDGAVNSIKIQDLSIVNVDISSSANIVATKLQSTVMVEGENVSLLSNDAGYLSSVNSANITDGTVVDADVSNTANISASKLQSTVMVETENVSLLNNDAGYLTSVNSASITDGSVVDADVSASANIASSKLQSTVMVETENVSLLNNDAGYLTSVNSASITDGSVVDADVSATANIASSKLQSTVMVETENVSLLNNDAGYITTVTSADITDGTIVNADVSGIAAIDGSKINPDFGSQNIQTTGSLNSGAATVSSLTVTNMGGANDTYTGDGAVNFFTISAGGVFSSSDVRLKTNIEDIPRALDKIAMVEGKSYTFKSDQEQQLHFGVIAQDLQKLFPHLVHQNEEGYLSVNYLELIPVLIEALKEQQSTIQQLAQALKRGQELNNELKVGLNKQQKLVRTQQFILTQLQMDRAAMEKDIKEIKQSLGLEAKK